jgi:hypothetical protein
VVLGDEVTRAPAQARALGVVGARRARVAKATTYAGVVRAVDRSATGRGGQTFRPAGGPSRRPCRGPIACRHLHPAPYRSPMRHGPQGRNAALRDQGLRRPPRTRGTRTSGAARGAKRARAGSIPAIAKPRTLRPWRAGRGIERVPRATAPRRTLGASWVNVVRRTARGGRGPLARSRRGWHHDAEGFTVRTIRARTPRHNGISNDKH